MQNLWCCSHHYIYNSYIFKILFLTISIVIYFWFCSRVFSFAELQIQLVFSNVAVVVQLLQACWEQANNKLHFFTVEKL